MVRGAVVNESLMSGVPVICSDTCGASCLLDGEIRGEVFKSNSINSLNSILYKWILRGKIEEAKKKSIIEWSECLSGNNVSNYTLDLIDYIYSDKSTPKPIEPWCS